nr:hypothetical protein [uncultured Flavobacterium sp.]
MRLSKIIEIFFKLLFLFSTSLIFVYFVLFTKYVPDIYVFVQYAVKDSIERTVDINSIVSNNFLFDLMILFGDAIGIMDFTDWIILIIVLSLLFFVSKYSLLIFTGRFFGVLIVYVASFFVDLNQLRFNFGLFFLFLAFWVKKKHLRLFFMFFSFCSHLIPFFLSIVTFARLNFKKFIFIIIPVLVLALTSGVFLLFSDSRLLDYASADGSSKYPKTLILFFPVLYYLTTTKIDEYLFLNMKNFAITLLGLGFILFFVNFELAARFFEVAFIQIAILNVYYKKSLTFDLILFCLSISVLGSRLIGGISNSSNFIDVYQ